MLNLVKSAQKGNNQAFSKLFQAYEQDIYRIAFVYVKNQNDALDVVQETACRSFKAIKDLKEPTYFKTWLLKIAVNCSLDLLRRQQKVVQLKPELQGNIADNANEYIDLRMTLYDLMECLDEYEKSVVMLKFYEDLTFNEVAETLDIPLGTAKTIVYRALDKLRNNLKGDDLRE